MKIIITENQSQSLKEKLQNLVKKHGWDRGVMSVGEKNLLKFGFDNDPMEFLNMYNDLDVVQSEERSTFILYRTEPRKNLLIHNVAIGAVYINFHKIWVILTDKFKCTYDDAKELTEKWLLDIYNLKVISGPLNSPEYFSYI
jgi:hypothetical protein